jgi:hypothetical protein
LIFVKSQQASIIAAQVRKDTVLLNDVLALSFCYTRRPTSKVRTSIPVSVPLVNRLWRMHCGDFLPHEGVNDIAMQLFRFPSIATYEDYRQRIKTDPDC